MFDNVYKLYRYLKKKSNTIFQLTQRAVEKRSGCHIRHTRQEVSDLIYNLLCTIQIEIFCLVAPFMVTYSIHFVTFLKLTTYQLLFSISLPREKK